MAVNYVSSPEAAQQTVSAIEDAGGRAAALRGDVGDSGEVERLFSEIAERWGPVEILVNNAGITRDRLLLRMSTDDWDAVLTTNLRSVYLCTKTALRSMVRARWGRIVSIGSVAGLSGNAGQANYAAAKAGIIGFTKSVAREVGSRGITANVVAPGFITTEMTDGLSEEVKTAAIASIAAGRFGSPADVAAAVGYLASDEAAFVTGQVLLVDGGMAL